MHICIRSFLTASAACLALVYATSCSRPAEQGQQKESAASEKPAPPTYFHVDPAKAGVVRGVIRFQGKAPKLKAIDMDQDPACSQLHRKPLYDQPLVVNKNGTLSNVFVYIKTGLEGKQFEPPSTPVTIDQKGCWFTPRVLGVQTGQNLQVVNSDPVTHNIHPMPETNREWNHSQSPDDAPFMRVFTKPEQMIRVKCNVHHWMHAYIGVLDHPYFAITGEDGSFEIKNVPAGAYTIDAWQETLGDQTQPATVSPASTSDLNFTFKEN